MTGASLITPVQTPSVGASSTLEQKTTKAAHDFEAMAINQMLQPMFETDDNSGSMFNGGIGEKQFKPMLVEQIAHSMEQNGGIGLSDVIQKQMLAMQEQA
ncbi:chemotactic signal-response protein CheL [Neokomagataea thailandica NBRC 106555]|uniref:Chemotaxis protein chel n=2 Tax=Neokomagataea TaxID=1223423 RepID=A0A4Y6V529_9PROT|nr:MULTISPECIES: rod-binding protein [Neokomagataea]QDH25033.1 chemotaxis protein chel [Neokomagataea tanensis]GBR51443.1 chemotactic signal-response protein CheL [Neokomagataea thailandica NBRC 106555]